MVVSIDDVSFQPRHIRFAFVEGLGASWVKRASTGRIDGAWHVTL